MDLELYGRVLWRFRIVVLLGVVLAFVLAFFAMANVNFSTGRATYRAKEQWASYSRIFVTQKGFPYGALQTNRRDPTTLAANAVFFANVATTDPVMRRAFGTKPPQGSVEAAALTVSPTSTDTLPIISVVGLAETAQQAEHLARAETAALISYVRSLQEQSQTPRSNRILLQVIQQPSSAKLLKGRSKTVPIVVFLTVMAATIGLVFILENMRPRVRVVDSDDRSRRLDATSRSA